MTAARGPGIVGVGETPSLRHPGPETSTAGLMAEAIAQALRGAGLAPGHVDGLGVASFTLRPDRAIDLAWQLGLRLNWCMQDEMGGASAINLLRQAWLALEVPASLPLPVLPLLPALPLLPLEPASSVLPLEPASVPPEPAGHVSELDAG